MHLLLSSGASEEIVVRQQRCSVFVSSCDSRTNWVKKKKKIYISSAFSQKPHDPINDQPCKQLLGLETEITLWVGGENAPVWLHRHPPSFLAEEWHSVSAGLMWCKSMSCLNTAYWLFWYLLCRCNVARKKKVLSCWILFMYFCAKVKQKISAAGGGWETYRKTTKMWILKDHLKSK